MNKNKNNTMLSTINPHVKVVILTVVVTAIVVVFAYLNRPPVEQSNLNTQPAEAAGGFLTTNGYNLTWNNQKVVLKGVNFDNIGALGNSIGTNPSMDAITTTEEDYARLAQHGGNHARLGLSYVWYSTNQARFFQEMDNQLSWAKKHGIWVTFNMFTTPGDCYEGYGNSCPFWGGGVNSNGQLFGEPLTLANFWRTVAARYKNEPALAGYDLLNEPTPGESVNWQCSHWFNIAQAIRNSVTEVDSNHLIFIEACSDPAFDRVFKNANGSKATNVVYEVHDYDPMSITHTENTGAQYPGTHNVWTNAGTEEAIFLNKAQFSGSGPDPRYSTYEKYSIKWAKDNQVPIYMGEWGARGFANSYVQYIKDKGELYNQWEANHAFYTWEHQNPLSVDDSGRPNGWRWGIYQSQRGPMSTVVDTAKLNAWLVSLQGAVRPNFDTGGVVITPGGGTPVTPAPVTPGPVVTPAPVTPAPNTGSGTLTLATPLLISATRVGTSGGVVTGTVTYKNTGTGNVTIEDMAIAARPPGGTNAGGPYLDFSPYLSSQGSKTLTPGQSFTFTASRTFSTSDPLGNWYVFSTVKLAGQNWTDAPAQYNKVLEVVNSPFVTSAPVVTPVPVTPAPVTPQPNTGSYPKKISPASDPIEIYEVKAPQGSTIYLQAKSSVKNLTQVDWYINGRWYSQDNSQPFEINNGNGYTLSGTSVTVRAVGYYDNTWNFIDTDTVYTLGSNTGGGTNPNPGNTGYPREIVGNNSNFKLYETKPRQGNTVYLQAVPNSGTNAVIVAWYIDGRWKTEDRSAPFFLGSESSGFTLSQTSALIRVVGYNDTTYNQFKETRFTY